MTVGSAGSSSTLSTPHEVRHGSPNGAQETSPPSQIWVNVEPPSVVLYRPAGAWFAERTPPSVALMPRTPSVVATKNVLVRLGSKTMLAMERSLNPSASETDPVGPGKVSVDDSLRQCWPPSVLR